MNVLEKMNRPAFVHVELTKDCRYGKAGARVQFSYARAEHVVDSGSGVIVTDETPAKRGPGRPPGVKIENKSLGAA